MLLRSLNMAIPSCNLAQEYGFPAAKFYDEEFRKVRVLFNLDWSSIHDELWRKAIDNHIRGTGDLLVQKPMSKLPFRRGLQREQHARGSVGDIVSMDTVPIPAENINTVASNVGYSTQQLLSNRTKPPNLPSPIRVDRFKHYLRAYPKQLREILLNGFTVGFSLGATSEISILSTKNHKSALRNPEITQAKITKELNKGRYKGPFDSVPFSKFVCSPLGVVPKKEVGQFHLIHDWSYPKGAPINDYIPKAYTSV